MGVGGWLQFAYKLIFSSERDLEGDFGQDLHSFVGGKTWINLFHSLWVYLWETRLTNKTSIFLIEPLINYRKYWAIYFMFKQKPSDYKNPLHKARICTDFTASTFNCKLKREQACKFDGMTRAWKGNILMTPFPCQTLRWRLHFKPDQIDPVPLCCGSKHSRVDEGTVLHHY